MDGKKDKKSVVSFVKFFVFVLFFAAVGYLLGQSFGGDYLNTDDAGDIFLNILLGIAAFVVGAYIQIIAHETGHLIAGLISGYKLIFFRIGPFTFVRHGRKTEVKKFRVKGTAGQCLMMPPDGSADKIPYKFYNYGGVLMNVLISVVSALCYVFLDDIVFVTDLFLALAVVGLFLAVMNGMPMRVNGITNDGFNATLIAKDEYAKRAFFSQLRIIGSLSAGVRVKDMPKEWFFDGDIADANNDFYMLTQYFLDKHDFQSAKYCIARAKFSPRIPPVQQMELECENLFLKIIDFSDSQTIQNILTPQLKSYIKHTLNNISRQRQLYAYELLYKTNGDKAIKHLELFAKYARVHPFSVEIAAEKELIDTVNAIALGLSQSDGVETVSADENIV